MQIWKACGSLFTHSYCSTKLQYLCVTVKVLLYIWNSGWKFKHKYRLCGKCIVGQSSAKFDKVDMFSKQAIKKQSWQSWCIFLSIFKNIMQSKVGKVEMWIHYSRQSWQSSDFYISNNGQSSYPRQSWQSWEYFWTNLASL